MQTITLKNSDLRVSRICMGGCPLGGYGWGETQDRELTGAVRRALEVGITFFDTADTYGLGHSETLLGRALGADRSRVTVATKFGVRVENGRTFYDNSPRWLRQACRDSLQRLGTDYIDLYQIHYRDGVTPLEQVVEALEQLKAEGMIRYYGLSNIHGEDIRELRRFSGQFVSFQDEYSLACRKNEKDIRDFSRELSLTPMTWGSLGQGILTGKYDENSVFGADDRRSRPIYENFHGEKLRKNLRIVEVLKKIAAAHGRTAAETAVQFILDYIPGSVALCGAKRPEQVMGTADWSLSAQELQLLDEVSA